MRIGNLRTKLKTVKTVKGIETEAYAVQGRKKGTNLWDECYDPHRDHPIYGKWLFFDLEYDACAMLVAFAQWFKEYNQMNRQQQDLPPAVKAKIERRIKEKYNRRKKTKQAKQSKKKNRNKK